MPYRNLAVELLQNAAEGRDKEPVPQECNRCLGGTGTSQSQTKDDGEAHFA